ncbi:hypothetical protein ACHWQZ_G012255 [Mnemiopsis leidyi]
MWKGKSTHGIMKQDGEINFSKLEQQIDSAVEADKMYWIRNEAKIRAVNNKVASYEEFEDIVKASHLKPLEKGDRISDIKVFKQPWNINSGSESGSQTTSSKSTEIANNSVDNVIQFNRVWKRQCKNSLEQFNFLTELDCSKIHHIFQAEIAMGLLGEFVSVLHDHYQVEKSETVANILYTFTKCGRFDLSLMFLSQEEKKCLSKVMNSLSNDWNSKNVSQLKEVYKIDP